MKFNFNTKAFKKYPFSKHLVKKAWLYSLLITTNFLVSQEKGKCIFEIKKNPFIQVGDSNNIFFDYDSDGDLDLVISGYNKTISDSSSTHTFLYRNDGKGNFTKDLRSTLMGVEYGKIDVADIDNDTDLDLIVTGQELREHREDAAIIYKNNAGVFTKKTKFKDEHSYVPFASFININNDQYVDVLVQKRNVVEYYIGVKGEDFRLQGELKGVDAIFEYGIIPFDMDNDGDDDIILQGEMELGAQPKTLLFKNELGTYKSVPHNFKNTYQGTVKIVDVDNDGDQDVFMTNLGSLSESLENSYVYINDNGNFKAKVLDIPAYDIPVSCFVDLDNDGDKDIIIMGSKHSPPNGYADSADIYLNRNGQFKLFKENAFTYLGQGSITGADVDGDGDQDVLITGYQEEEGFTILYSNKLKE